MEFGAWDGLTFAEVAERHPDELDAWLGSLDVGARRAASRSGSWRSGCWPASSGCSTAHAGRTVVVVSHVTPIKTLVAHALDAPLESVFRMELTPGIGDACCRSSSAAGRADERASLRLFNALPPGQRRLRALTL